MFNQFVFYNMIIKKPIDFTLMPTETIKSTETTKKVNTWEVGYGPNGEVYNYVYEYKYTTNTHGPEAHD